MTIAPRLTIERGKRDKEQRRQCLIEAATAVFAERGYDGATTREIAERAGCAEGLIHRYFHGKRGLLLAILESRAARVIDDFAAALPDCATVEKEVERILLWHLDIMWERRDFMRVAVAQAVIDPEIGRTISEGVNAKRVRQIVEKLGRHETAGRLHPDVDVEAVAHSIAGLGFSVGFFYQVCFGSSRQLARRIILEAAAEISRGISRRST
jgi:AcrR family transcriptional regulator